MRTNHRTRQTLHTIILIILIHCLFDAIGKEKIDVVLLKLMARNLIGSLGKKPESRIFLKAL